jgi:two-component system sensor histidine kinase/response regulator
LNAIVGLSHLLARERLSAPHRDYVDKIHAAAGMLMDVINSVLDFSKIEAGRMSIESRRFHLDEVLEGVTNVLALKAQEKGLELLLSLDQNVPGALSGDPVRLGQVLTNLTGNAIKFTNEGEIVVDVRLVERMAEGVRVRFAVKDTGIGLSSEQLGRLFQPFTQADESPTRRFGGTGLGLVISRQLVELMGGRLEVESAPGAGSTFRFELALGIGDETAAATAALAPAFDVRGRRVLLVDDHETSRAVLGRYLGELSFDVVGAASGTEGLAMLRDAERDGSPFDLLLLDWRMPGLDGLEVIRRLRAAPPLGKPPTIIMVTAYGREEVEKQAQALGVNGLIVKPVTRSSLLDAITDAFGSEPARLRLSRPRRPAAASPVFRGARVLVVEDNAINRQVARELLEAAGAVVSLANNGVEALAAIGADGVHLDAVLMDLQMPEMDGYEAARTIRKDPRHDGLPIIAMTAHAFEEERARCRDAGMDAHVSKPVDPDELFAVLGSALDRSPGGALPREAVAPPAAPAGAANLADALPEVPGVDVASALNRLGGNRKLYVRLLLDLTRDQRDASERIARELAMGARDEAERRAHTLRGAAANLGADEVASAARAVEDAIHKAEGVAACEAALRLLAARLEALSTAVLGRLAQPDVTQAPTPRGPSGAVADLRSLTADLETLLEKRNLRAQDVLAELKQAPLPAPLREALAEIEVRVAALEYGPAADLLRHATTRAGLIEGGAVPQ